ncbi:Zn-dependent M28 family amino/carboxypeptidase [Duganella sp. 1411]|uniref:M28 family metallopeptidase n=1 Tax=Duganella sp. 1411 TaxID=2806572 RepID=UPI001B4933AD|nr:M28 family metallopeptidase [Duganella sp. 1411]MBP1207087.1 Zn-dependent M28 family amino/carboxypeptidase [Duganella sp. 1411]
MFQKPYRDRQKEISIISIPGLGCNKPGTYLMKLVFIWPLIGCFAAAGAAQPSAPWLSPLFAPARLSQDVRILASDEFEGRAPYTAAETKTVDYLVTQMRRAGLQPGGDIDNGKRSWIQPVRLVRSEHVSPPSASITIGGVQQTLSQGQEVVIRATLNGSSSVDIDSAPVVFIGYGVSAPERNWDDFKGVDLHGKVALVLINDPDFETGEGDFGGREMTYYGRWTYKFEEALRRGASAVFIIHETAPASYGWELVRNTDTLPLFDIERDDPASIHPQLEGWMHRDSAVTLFERAGLDFEVLKQVARTREFHPVELADARFSTSYQVNLSTVTSKNVVGRINGRVHPEESVVYVAHWDHLGIGSDDAQGDHVFNGAFDNATGVAGLLELGRRFANGPSPQRSLIFLAVTSEEKGLLGSEYYVSNPSQPLSKTAGVINIDILDPHGPARNFTSAGNPKLDLLDDLKVTAKHWGLYFAPDKNLAAGRFFRSDHFSFAKRGVPAVWFQSGNDWYHGGATAGDAEMADFYANRYHQRGDEWSPAWSFTGMARDVSILYQFGLDLANSRRWPNWGADSEFRAVRDQTAAERP